MAVPQIDEQESNAARVEELSAARRLQRADLTPELLRDTLEAVATDDDIRASAIACSAALQRSDGPARGATTLENHIT